MKKPTSGRGREAKSSSQSDVEDYLARVSEPARSTLDKVRKAIRAVVPTETTECLSYQIPTFKYKGGLVAFAAFKNHCSLFPMSYAVIRKFHKELKNFQVSKGTVRFPLDKPLPASLLKRIVRARIAEKERK